MRVEDSMLSNEATDYVRSAIAWGVSFERAIEILKQAWVEELKDEARRILA